MNKLRIGDFPIGPDERAAVNRVLDSGRISEGRECHAFEEEFADWLGVRHCVTVNSGTSALIAGLKATEYAKRIPPNAKVLMPALTFVATANAVLAAGMQPVFGDVDARTLSLWPGEVLQRHCDLVLPVHLFGYAADVDTIARNAQYCINIPSVVMAEDAAEAHGTTVRGRKVGAFGLWSAFSFYIAHTIQAGELGCVCTDDDDIAALARSVKAHGRSCTCKRCVRAEGNCPHLASGDPRFRSQVVGYNFKPMEFQAALARVQLAHFDENAARRAVNVDILSKALEVLAGDALANPFYRQKGAVHMAFPVVLQRQGVRDKVLVALEAAGVECRPLFGCIPTQQPAYWRYLPDYEGRLPVADYLGANGFYVGCHQYLETADVERMGETIVDVVRQISQE